MNMDLSRFFSPLLGVSLLIAALLSLMPENGAKRIASMVACALLLFTVLPGLSDDGTSLERMLSDYRQNAEESLKASETKAENELIALTREYAARLIEEKAETLSLKISAACEVAWNEENELYIDSVTLRYLQTPDEEDAVFSLREWIRTTLGVPLKKQRHIR